jgi:hypothetical protein
LPVLNYCPGLRTCNPDLWKNHVCKKEEIHVNYVEERGREGRREGGIWRESGRERETDRERQTDTKK